MDWGGDNAKCYGKFALFCPSWCCMEAKLGLLLTVVTLVLAQNKLIWKTGWDGVNQTNSWFWKELSRSSIVSNDVEKMNGWIDLDSWFRLFFVFWIFVALDVL